MAEPAAPAAETPAKHHGLLTRKLGPLPTWAWVVIVAAIIIGYAWFKARKSSQQAQPSSAAGAGQVPQFVNQTFVGPEPPEPPSTGGRHKGHDHDRDDDDDDDDGRKRRHRKHFPHEPKPRRWRHHPHDHGLPGPEPRPPGPPHGPHPEPPPGPEQPPPRREPGPPPRWRGGPTPVPMQGAGEGGF